MAIFHPKLAVTDIYTKFGTTVGVDGSFLVVG